MNVAYAEVNFTISSGFKVSPAGPPIVPRIPEIEMCIRDSYRILFFV